MPSDAFRSLSPGQCATLACLLESAIPKPGNVHRSADFADTSLYDFLISAVCIGPAMESAADLPLGRTILSAVEATRAHVGPNTNLGMILLLAPLAAARPLNSHGVEEVLEASGPDDAACVYEAIRVCRPGGLGRVARFDVRDQPPQDLRQAMRAAPAHDLIARQYCNGFAEVFGRVVPGLREGLQAGQPLVDVVIHTHVTLMHEFPDSLIQRKCGAETAHQAAALAGCVLQAGLPGSPDYLRRLEDLDFWLRQDGHRRNPGTTADMITAGLFVCLRCGHIRWPLPTTSPAGSCEG